MPPETDELDRYFTALAAHADRVPVGTAQTARRLGRRRRQRSATIAAALAVLIAGGASAAVLGNRPPATPPVQPGTFVPLGFVGGVPMALAAPGAPAASATIVDSVAYVAGQGLDSVQVAALELTTGHFVEVELPGLVEIRAFAALRDSIVVAGLTSDGSAVQIMVLDPALQTGYLRWQDSVAPDTHVYAYRDAIISHSLALGTITAFDWGTGAQLWSRPIDASRGLTAVYPEALELPSSLGGWHLDPTGHRLLAATSAGEVDIIDVRTGASLSHLSVDQPGWLFALGDNLYAGIAEDLYVQPLDGTGTLTKVYSGASRAYPCGDGLLCVLRSTGRITVLDSGDYRTVADMPFGSSGTAVGDRFVSPNGDVLDLAGNPVVPRLPHTPAWWISPGSVLTLDPSDTPSGGAVAVGGLSTGDGTWTELGRLPGPLSADRCTVDQHYLVCALTDGFFAWQFAAR